MLMSIARKGLQPACEIFAVCRKETSNQLGVNNSSLGAIFDYAIHQPGRKSRRFSVKPNITFVSARDFAKLQKESKVTELKGLEADIAKSNTAFTMIDTSKATKESSPSKCDEECISDD